MSTQPSEPNHLAPSTVDNEGLDDSHPRRFLGIAMGALVPVCLGVAYILWFGSRLPEPQEGSGNCGTGGLLGVAMILFGTPLGALIGGSVATYWKQGDV